ncbi:MAG: VOC family protein [Rhizobiaceae bacterium]|nr:VOC family protein [Rhizobiaceae bacterium]
MIHSARPIDHCVLPTASLTVARARLSKLGFTVAPNGLHPFGTGNCCVYFSDGTFLEPLAVANATSANAAIADGNVFVARDHDWRKHRGEEGFSALVFGSADADADHAAFVAACVSAGRRLDFSRTFTDASGRADVASFRLAFAADPTVPDAFVFTCERANAPMVDRSALQTHENGVSRVKAVLVDTTNIARFIPLFAAVTGLEPRTDATGAVFAAANGDIILREVAGSSHSPAADLTFSGIVFGTHNLGGLAESLAGRGIMHSLQAGRLVVPPEAGQGAAFIFEDL